MNKSRSWRIVFVTVWAIFAVLRILGSFDRGGGAGRRPDLSAPPVIDEPRLPAERVRRPPLNDPDALDPIFTVEDAPIPPSKIGIGTAFSIDSHGVWFTARHVANDICRQVVLVVDGHPQAATMAFVHPESDVTVLRTAQGAPTMPLETARPTDGEVGFSFGYPTGILGATQDTLMGRSRMQFAGRLSGMTPTLTWAEESRFPPSLETLGGMSGGPMFDQGGRVVGSVVAASKRRGRVETVAPELLRQVESESGIDLTASPAVAELADPTKQLSDIAKALNSNSRIAKVYCRPAS